MFLTFIFSIGLLLEQTLQGYQRNGDTIGQAIVLSNLALSYQQLGKWQEANQAIDSIRLAGEQASP